MKKRMLALVGAAVLVGTLVGSPAQVVTNAPFRWGFVWANLPAAGSYTSSTAGRHPPVRAAAASGPRQS